MKLQQLHVFLAVVEEGGIRAAARRLHLSQAAVTKTMRHLEEDAGLQFLVRKARGVLLTPAGERLLLHARAIARQVQLAQEDLRQAAGEDAGTLRVGITPFLTLTALGPAFNWFRQRYRQVEVQVSEGLMARVLPRLREGTLDMAAVAVDVGDRPGGEFRCQCVLQVPQCLVVRAGHPVLKDPSAQALAALEWVATHPIGTGAHPQADAMFSQTGSPPPARVIQCDSLAALTLLRHSDAVGVFPRPLLGHPETRGIVPVESPALHPCDLELLLLSRADLPLTPAAEHFAYCLTQVALEAVPGSGAGLRSP
jgi:DNA-binding transcriptional LysR family regulator